MLPSAQPSKPSIKTGTPDHEDVNIILKLYELRREAVMREARNAMFRFSPKSYEEFTAITSLAHPQNAYFRQVASFWEMCSTFVNQGALHEELFWQTNGEGLFFYAIVEPFIERYRKEENPMFLAQLDEMIRRRADGRQRIDAIKARLAKMAEAAKKGR